VGTLVTVKGIVLALNRFPVLAEGYDMVILNNSVTNCNMLSSGGEELWLDVRFESTVAWSLFGSWGGSTSADGVVTHG
jgi:hypothetical protein